MHDRQRLARFAPALALFLATAFLALSLVGYDPADPPGSASSPVNDPPSNPCGPVGATLAHVLFASVGWSSYLLLYAVVAADLLLFLRRPVPDKGLRAFGLGLVVCVLAAVVQWSCPGLRPCHPVGSGGYLGALVATSLESQFGFAGLLLILSSAGLVGLALCVDVVFLWPAREASALYRRLRPPFGSVPVAPPAAGTSLMLAEPNFEVVGSDTLPPVAITSALPVGRPATPAASPPVVVNAASRGQNPSVQSGPPGWPALAVQGPADGSYQCPPLGLLEKATPYPIQDHEAKIHSRALLLERTLLDFGYQVRVVQIDTGPVITQFEIELEAGLRVSKVMGLADDLAIALAVPSVRIVAPIPGKTTVGIEVPNEHRAMVRLGEVINAVQQRTDKNPKIPLYLGKDVKGVPLAFDLADMPHLLIAGRTGTGKSVCLNAMILSILMTKRPDEVKLILMDPKKVEMTQFRRLPHLMHPVVTDDKKFEPLLSWLCDKMDERYGYLARAGVRNIHVFNQLGAEEVYNRLKPEDDEERKRIPTYMPYIVIVIDELAEMFLTGGKEIETHIVRLAQKARAAGIHLIVATQKPTVDVITGLIKGNLPARIAFQVSSKGDSRVVLDEMGADKLLGNGDMLFLFPGTSHIIRAQGTYVSDLEVERVCGYLEQYPVEFNREMMQLQVGGGGGKDRGEALKEREPLYETAIEIIIREGRGSCSLLQRALGIGYGRAARLIDFMAEDGILGEFKSGSAREVLYTLEEWEALKNGGDSSTSAA